ncbi:hypothetical protein KR018_000515 [Drosophila ironensis]|nr:hypothetical protein KR018_000515 [Drosophila ironensis]
MFADAALPTNANGKEVSEKRPLTGASVNMKRLLKTFKRIFGSSKPSTAALYHTCHTEEEHQNWLNEQLEAKLISL